MTSPQVLRRLLVPALAALVLLSATAGCIIDYQLENNPTSVVVRVAADEPWTDTGIDLLPGERLEIDYVDGMWSPWPGGAYDAIGSGGDPRCDCNRLMGASHAALIGHLGDGEPFLVADHWEGIVGQGGRLLLGMNDSRLDDNSGWLEVRIRTES